MDHDIGMLLKNVHSIVILCTAINMKNAFWGCLTLKIMFWKINFRRNLVLRKRDHIHSSRDTDIKRAWDWD